MMITNGLLLAVVLAVTGVADEPAAPRRGADLEIRASGTGATVAPRATFAEGAFLAERDGAVYKTASGNLVFVADEVAGGGMPGVSGPIAFLPNEALGKLEALAGVGMTGGAGPSTAVKTGANKAEPALELVNRMTVSGQLFTFHNNTYILLSVTPAEVGVVVAIPKDAAPAAEKSAEAGKTAADLMADLESRRTTPRAMEAAAIKTGPTESAETQKDGAGERGRLAKRKEGEQIASRQGRIVRHDAWLVFSPDSGVGEAGKEESDTPIVLLACKQLERLEWLAKQSGDNARYRVSGRVTTYRGRNYLLPLMVQVLPPGDLMPRH